MSANGEIIEIRFGPLQCLSKSDDWKDRTKMCTIIFQYIIWFQRMFTFLQNPDKWIGTIGDMFRAAINTNIDCVFPWINIMFCRSDGFTLSGIPRIQVHAKRRRKRLELFATENWIHSETATKSAIPHHTRYD